MATNPATIIDIATGERITRTTDTSRTPDYLRGIGALSITTTVGDGITPEADMSSIKEIKAVNVRGPHQGEVYRFALTASSVTYGIPSAWNTKFMTIKAVGGTLQYQLGDAGETTALVFDQVGSGTATPSSSAASGKTLSDGQEDSFRLNGESLLKVISDGSTGYVEFYLSTQSDNS